MRKRVVVTGLGLITPLGVGKRMFWDALAKGKSGVQRVTRFDASGYPCQVAGEVYNFEPLDFLPRKKAGRMDRSVQFGVAASKMAVEDAGLDLARESSKRIGVAIGTTLGGQEWASEQQRIFWKEGPAKMNPFTAGVVFPNACSSEISIELGLKGPSLTFSTACASASNAIGYGLSLLRKGEMDVMVAGGTEAPIFPICFNTFYLARIMTSKNGFPPQTPAPFDKKRDGTVLSEGAGILIIETLEHALKRNARIYAEIAGYSTTCDAHHMTGLDPGNNTAAYDIKLALQDADLSAEDVDCIHAYACGTALGDKLETFAIKKAFGDYAYRVAVSATKSMLGHTQGASGAIELAAACLAMENETIPPTINYTYPDPECDLDCVPNEARRSKIDVSLLNCFSFGSKNAILVIKRY